MKYDYELNAWRKYFIPINETKLDEWRKETMYVNVCRKAGGRRRGKGDLVESPARRRVRLDLSPRPIFELLERPEASSCPLAENTCVISGTY